jgi:DNA-binding protein H-NS
MGMIKAASVTPESPTAAIVVDEMANAVLLVGEWLVKQQQLLKQQQRLIEEQQSQIEAQQEQIEQLKDSLDKLKNRSSQNSCVPPSSDQLKKPSDKTKRKKGKKRGPKYDHPGKTRNGFGQPDKVEQLQLENCPVCGGEVQPAIKVPKKYSR